MTRSKWLLPFATLLFVILGCDAWVSVDGIVTDESNNPIEEAKVVIKQGNHIVGEYITDKEGRFHAFESIAPFPFSFTSILDGTIVKIGYETQELEIDANERRTPEDPLRIVLVRSGQGRELP